MTRENFKSALSSLIDLLRFLFIFEILILSDFLRNSLLIGNELIGRCCRLFKILFLLTR